MLDRAGAREYCKGPALSAFKLPGKCKDVRQCKGIKAALSESFTIPHAFAHCCNGRHFSRLRRLTQPATRPARNRKAQDDYGRSVLVFSIVGKIAAEGTRRLNTAGCRGGSLVLNVSHLLHPIHGLPIGDRRAARARRAQCEDHQSVAQVAMVLQSGQ